MTFTKGGIRNIGVWVRAFRLPFLTATAVPVMLGGVIAWHETGVVNWTVFVLTLIGVSFLHLGTNVMNDYSDHQTRNDWVNKTPTPVSGGSRVIQEGLLSPRAILAASIGCFAAGSAVGLFIAWYLKSLMIIWMGVFGVFCGLFYTASPLRIGYRGFGELIVGFCFGPLVVFGSYYAQTLEWSSVPVVAAVPLGILIGLVLLINEFPDYEADKAVGKKTLVVMFEHGKSEMMYFILLGGVYLYTFCCVFFKILPIYSLGIVITLPAAFKACSVLKRNRHQAYKLLPANFATINLHLSIGLLLSAGFFLDKLL